MAISLIFPLAAEPDPWKRDGAAPYGSLTIRPDSGDEQPYFFRSYSLTVSTFPSGVTSTVPIAFT